MAGMEGGDSSVTREELIEKLADAEHASWARWMEYLFGLCEMQQDGSLIIPADSVRHWDRQVRTKYSDLTEREKESDRQEVAVILPLIEHWCAEAMSARIVAEIQRQGG